MDAQTEPYIEDLTSPPKDRNTSTQTHSARSEPVLTPNVYPVERSTQIGVDDGGAP